MIKDIFCWVLTAFFGLMVVGAAMRVGKKEPGASASLGFNAFLFVVALSVALT